MAKITQVIVLSSRRLHGFAWSAMLKTEAFLDVVAVIDEPDRKNLEINDDQPLAILVDHFQPQPEDAQRLTDTWSEAGSLFLLNTLDPDELAAFVAAGASGFLDRNSQQSELTRGLIAVGRGELALPPEYAGQILRRLAQSSGEATSPAQRLTDREEEVLSHLAQGLTNKDIAQSLMISVRTVEAHVRNIYGKLEVGSRTEAALWAVRHNFGVETNEN